MSLCTNPAPQGVGPRAHSEGQVTPRCCGACAGGGQLAEHGVLRMTYTRT